MTIGKDFIMKKDKFRKCSILVSSVVFLTGCSGKSQSEQNNSIIPKIKTGMTSEEVFKIVGEDYDYSITEDYYESTVEYDYYVKAGEVFETNLDGYMCFEFDKESDTLITYGYHLGQTGSFEDCEYPYTEQELKAAYDAIKNTLDSWYGDGVKNEENAEYGVKEEYTWQKDDNEIWAIYGTNLWAIDEPEKYENGLNEVVFTCTSRFE